MIGLSFVLAVENKRVAVLLEYLILVWAVSVHLLTGHGVNIKLAHVADLPRRLQLGRMLILTLELILAYDA